MFKSQSDRSSSPRAWPLTVLSKMLARRPAAPQNRSAATPDLAHRARQCPNVAPGAITQSGDTPHERTIGPAGIALIKRFEGCARKRSDGRIEAYPDPGTGAEPWTIGWGATGHDDQPGAGPGDRISEGTVWTQEQCDARLQRDLVRYARDVAKAIGDAPTSQAQFDALVSFHYNTGAISRATLTKRHAAGDIEGAALQFRRWKWAGGRIMRGLVRRRRAEERLYRSS